MRLTLPAMTLALVLSAAHHAVSRQSSALASPPAETTRVARPVLKAKALALLDEVVKDARGLSLAENRAYVLAAVADLLWAHDEERARALFKEAGDNIGGIT